MTPILTAEERAAVHDGVACAHQPCAGCPLCAGTDRPTPVDDTAALIRWDIAAVARRHGNLRTLNRAIAVATTRADWDDVIADLASLRGRTGDTFARGNLTHAADAAALLSRGAVDEALRGLADSCGLSTNDWLDHTRRERAEGN